LYLPELEEGNRDKFIAVSSFASGAQAYIAYTDRLGSNDKVT